MIKCKAAPQLIFIFLQFSATNQSPQEHKFMLFLCNIFGLLSNQQVNYSLWWKATDMLKYNTKELFLIYCPCFNADGNCSGTGAAWLGLVVYFFVIQDKRICLLRIFYIMVDFYVFIRYRWGFFWFSFLYITFSFFKKINNVF